jgi:hypothetical protein
MKPGHESKNVPLERKPLLVGEDDTIVRPDLDGEEEAATGAGPLDVPEEELAERQKSEVEPDLPGPAWQGVVFAMLPVLICLFGAGRRCAGGDAAALGVRRAVHGGGGSLDLAPGRRGCQPRGRASGTVVAI